MKRSMFLAENKSEGGSAHVEKDVAVESIPSPIQETAPAMPFTAGPWEGYVRQLAEGQQNALMALYDETNSLVYTLALRILGDVTEAEEITLDVYVQVWQNATSYDSSRGTVPAWLITMARSRAIDRVRQRTSRARHEELRAEFPDFAAVQPTPEQDTLIGQQQLLVRSAVAALPAEQREAIELAYFSGLSHQEMAVRLGQPLGTIKTRILLAMQKLRKQLVTLG